MAEQLYCMLLHKDLKKSKHQHGQE